MRIILITYLILSIPICNAFGQDFLFNNWENENNSDSIRIHSMNNYLNSVWSGKVQISPDSAIVLSKKLEKFSKDIYNNKGIVYALNTQILGYAFVGEFNKAEKSYNKSIRISNEKKFQREASIAHYNMGISYYLMNDLDSSIAYYKKALAIQYKLANQKDIVGTLTNIGSVLLSKGDFVNSLLYFENALDVWKKSKDKNILGQIYNNIALIYREFGNVQESIKYLKKSILIKEENEDKKGLAAGFHNIGIYYVEIEDYDNALNYFRKSLKLEKETKNQRGIAESYNSIGDVYSGQKKYDIALKNYLESKYIYKSLGDRKWEGVVLNNIANVYGKQGKIEKAIALLKESLQIHKSFTKGKEISNTYNLLGLNSIELNQYNKAVNYCEKGLKVAEEIKSFNLQKDNCECLYIAYKRKNNYSKALTYFEKMSKFNLELDKSEISKKLYQMEYEKQKIADSLVSEKKRIQTKHNYEEKLNNENQKRNIAIIVGFIFLLISGGLFSRIRYIRKSKLILEKERDTSEKLLLNILPNEIAKELKETGKSVARDYENVSIVFTDFKEFTQASENVNATELIEEVNKCFLEFDRICDEYNLEKIKTIGDSYLAVGGLPVPFEDSTINSVLACLEMKEFILKRKEEKIEEGQLHFEMRIGIHTGPVVAGIVGEKKFQYDIWGDSVNTASRMESSGVEGKVNISQATYDKIKDDPRFVFTPRGKVEAKGKGEIEMYFVKLSDSFS